ncbi:hypothetical protein FA15DRAFT_658993 [Coprinopsis marcescibilis]|uniref:CFEM domain-containing protein n=1 Tax=Coprinopsis marcescibilis TaxID=230819 RepID=A0A5C3KK86_COPMA|nr:hypothetical protein FA15DRAFT_658993 [Coprinopsis marcescibilis]
MFSSAVWLFVLAAAAITNAQSEVTVPAVKVSMDQSLHKCIRDCLAGTNIAVPGCEGVTDANAFDQACGCGVAQYPLQYVVCLENVCPISEVAAGEQALEDLCAPLNMTRTGTTSPPIEISVSFGAAATSVSSGPKPTDNAPATTTSRKNSGPTQAPIWAAPIAVAALAAHLAV